MRDLNYFKQTNTENIFIKENINDSLDDRFSVYVNNSISSEFMTEEEALIFANDVLDILLSRKFKGSITTVDFALDINNFN